MHIRLLIIFLAVLLAPQFVFAQEAPPVMQDTYARGKVVDIVDEQLENEFGLQIRSQKLEVKLFSGEEDGKTVRVTHQVEQNTPALVPLLELGDRVVVGKQQFEGEEPVYYISDMYRLRGMWLLFGVFMLLAIVFARWYGVRSLVGLAISFVVIMYFVVPQIAAGSNPLLVSLGGTLGIAASAIFIAHGFEARTHIAFASTLATIGVAFFLAWLAIHVVHLFGVGTEEAYYLRFAPIENLNLRWLLLGGIMIGMLGVLDDVTTAQAAAVEEIHKANTELGFVELYKRGSSVGREHIISLVNTLVLAYTGASLPLLLLFEIYERPAWVTLNSELVMEEVVRMLVGSIALVVAVPLTTLLAARYFGRK